MSRLDCEDGIDERRWEREMARPIAATPPRPTAAQLRALRLVAAGQPLDGVAPQTKRLIVRHQWMAYTEAGRVLTAAGQRLIGVAP